MIGRKQLALVIACIAVICTSAMAQDAVSVQYTGLFFSDYGASTFSATVAQNGLWVKDAKVHFEGMNLWGVSYNAGWGWLLPQGAQDYVLGPLVTTDVLGRGSARANWPPSLYEARAFADPSDSEFVGGESLPVAVTVISNQWDGIFAGGTVALSKVVQKVDYGNPVTLSRFQPVLTHPRTATLGFIYALPRNCHLSSIYLPNGDREEFLLIDPNAVTRQWVAAGTLADKCLVSTKISARDFRVSISPDCTNPTSVAVRGYCDMSQKTTDLLGDGGESELTGQFPFELTFSSQYSWPYGSTGCFSLKVYRLPYDVLYEASGEIRNGKLIIDCN